MKRPSLKRSSPFRPKFSLQLKKHGLEPPHRKARDHPGDRPQVVHERSDIAERDRPPPRTSVLDHKPGVDQLGGEVLEGHAGPLRGLSEALEEVGVTPSIGLLGEEDARRGEHSGDLGGVVGLMAVEDPIEDPIAERQRCGAILH